jgi:hypothetical protein
MDAQNLLSSLLKAKAGFRDALGNELSRASRHILDAQNLLSKLVENRRRHGPLFTE